MTQPTSGPISPVGIDHVVLRCAHLNATLAFYTQVLGCSLRRVDEKNQLYQLSAGVDALIDLVPVGSALGGDHAPTRGRHNMAHVCLRIADPDWQAIREHLVEQGQSWQEPRPRFGAQGRGLSIYVTDPEGNEVELTAEQNPE